MRLIPAVVTAVLSTMAFMGAPSAQPDLCSDILYLIEQSQTQFVEIRGDTDSDRGDYDAAFALRDASYCVIADDAEKASYRCAWTYPYGDEKAHDAFEQLVQEIRDCIGTMATERTDQSVNHPDFYASYYFELEDVSVSVNLKNKSNLMSTLVSVRIDGFAKVK